MLGAMRMLILALTIFAAACGDDGGSPQEPVDAAIDSPVDPCLTCALGQICVAQYDGTCKGAPHCVTRTIECAPNTCSADCQTAYCPSPYQCMNRSTCPGESPHAFNCYGP